MPATFPSSSVFLITPDDDNDLPSETKAISFAQEGALHIVTVDDTEVTIPTGYLGPQYPHPLRVKKVFATGTTATGILGWK